MTQIDDGTPIQSKRQGSRGRRELGAGGDVAAGFLVLLLMIASGACLAFAFLLFAPDGTREASTSDYIVATASSLAGATGIGAAALFVWGLVARRPVQLTGVLVGLLLVLLGAFANTQSITPPWIALSLAAGIGGVALSVVSAIRVGIKTTKRS